MLSKIVIFIVLSTEVSSQCLSTTDAGAKRSLWGREFFEIFCYIKDYVLSKVCLRVTYSYLSQKLVFNVNFASSV